MHMHKKVCDFFFFSFKLHFVYFVYVFIYMRMHVWHSACVKVGGQLVGVGFLFSLCGSKGSNPGAQT